MALVNAASSAPATLPVLEWLQLIGLGALVGATGQAARAIVGLKKLNDAAAGQMPVSEMVIVSRLVISFLIGAVAGALAALGTVRDVNAVSLQAILALAAAGYAGADFIEGFINRTEGAKGTPAGEGAIGTGSSEGGGASEGSAASDGSVG